MTDTQFAPYTEDQVERDDAGQPHDRKYVKLVSGKNVVRFLPAKPGGKPHVISWQHYAKTPTGTVVLTCPQKIAGRKCPLCELSNRLRRHNRIEDARQVEVRKRVFSSVIVRGQESEGPQILACGPAIKNQLDSIRLDPEDGGDYTHPETGFDLVIEKTGSGMATKYVVRPRRASRLEDWSWIDQQQDLSGFLHLQPDEKIVSLCEPVLAAYPLDGNGSEKPGFSDDDNLLF